jgi:hypothetical protein
MQSVVDAVNLAPLVLAFFVFYGSFPLYLAQRYNDKNYIITE